jgi:hypothetical protein
MYNKDRAAAQSLASHLGGMGSNPDEILGFW